MATVFIWSFPGGDAASGHVSMQCGDRYISWWPEPEGRVPQPGKRPGVHVVRPFIPRSYRSDVADQGGESPNWIIPVVQLDEHKIREWWASFDPQAPAAHGPPSRPWSPPAWNCSTVVATALTEGGGADVAPGYASPDIVWTPSTVRQYALAINRAAPDAGVNLENSL